MKLCLIRQSWHRKQSAHTKGVSQSSCEAVWFGGCRDRGALFWALPSTQSVSLGKGSYLSPSLIPSALLWVHGDISRCRNLLLPLTWGRRSSHLRTMKHHLAKSCAVSHTEFAGWISAPETVLVPSGQPGAWPDLGPVLA